MRKLFQAICQDIRKRKNLELYTVLVFIFIILGADIFGINTQTALFEIILATLALLVYGMLTDRHATQRIEDRLSKLSIDSAKHHFFNEWDDVDFRNRLRSARELSMVAVANYVFLGRNSKVLHEFVQRGGKIRCILVDPKGNAVEMLASSIFGQEKDHKRLVSEIENTIDQLERFVRTGSNDQNVEIKLVDFVPSSTLTMIDCNYPEGVMYVTLSGYARLAAQPPTEAASRRLRFWPTDRDNPTDALDIFIRHAQTSIADKSTNGKMIGGKMIRCLSLPIACLYFS